MIPQIIHQTAKTKALTFEERQLQHRIHRLMPDWQMKLWDDDDNDALILTSFPEFYRTYRSITRGVARADIARLAFLHAYGGFYVDTDYKLLRPLDAALLGNTCVLPISRDEDVHSPDFRICNSVLGSMPGYPLWANFIKEILGGLHDGQIRECDVEKTTGPEALTSFYLRNKKDYADAYLAPRIDFHPLITMKGFHHKGGRHSYGAHLCWGSWRNRGLVRNLKALVVRRLTWI